MLVKTMVKTGRSAVANGSAAGQATVANDELNGDSSPIGQCHHYRHHVVMLRAAEFNRLCNWFIQQ